MWSPVSGPVTSQFGWRLHPVSGGEDFHKGVDIAAAEGTSILAALPGVVEETGYNDSYGNFVVLRHSDNLRTTYNHCSEILVQEGQQMAISKIKPRHASEGRSIAAVLKDRIDYDKNPDKTKGGL